MRTLSCLPSVLLAACLAAPAADFRYESIDLTHPFDADTIYWPTASGFRLTIDSKGPNERGYWYEANSFACAEHGGTHLDAPAHFAEGAQTADQIPLERLAGSGVCIDVRAACAQDRDHQVTVKELRDWELSHGPIPAGAFVLLHTGFGAFWPDRERYLGTAERGPDAVPKLHFPGLHPDAARWLVERRSIAAVGLDTASIDHGPSRTFDAHVVLCTAQVPILENVAALERLPPTGFAVFALPMKIRGGSGAPARIVAILLDRGE